MLPGYLVHAVDDVLTVYDVLTKTNIGSWYPEIPMKESFYRLDGSGTLLSETVEQLNSNRIASAAASLICLCFPISLGCLDDRPWSSTFNLDIGSLANDDLLPFVYNRDFVLENPTARRLHVRLYEMVSSMQPVIPISSIVEAYEYGNGKAVIAARGIAAQLYDTSCNFALGVLLGLSTDCKDPKKESSRDVPIVQS